MSQVASSVTQPQTSSSQRVEPHSTIRSVIKREVSNSSTISATRPQIQTLPKNPQNSIVCCSNIFILCFRINNYFPIIINIKYCPKIVDKFIIHELF